MKFASLFSGGGLVDVAAKQLNLDLKFGCEFDKKIASIYKENFNHNLHVCDVGKLNSDLLEAIDILWMSPVCKNFSNAQSDKGDKLSDYEWITNLDNILDVCNPSAIIIENVKAYQSSYSFNIFQNILINRGYHLNTDVYDFSNFKVPQSRKRMICFATKKQIPKITIKYPKIYWYDHCKDLLKNFEYYQLQSKNAKRSQKLQSFTIFDYINASFPKSTPNRPIKNSLFFTVISTCHKAPYLLVLDNCTCYKFSTRALARIQTLPDDYILPQSYELACTIIGNGVPVNAARVCIEHILQNI